MNTAPHVGDIGLRLDRLPVSKHHKKLFLIVALAFMFDSVELAIMTFLLGSIKTEFGLSTAQAGFLASVSFFGMIFGASLAGLLADRFGRRPVFQTSIVVWALGSFLCALAPNYWVLLLCRIIIGFGMGMEFPVAQTMLSEIIPARSRGRYVAMMDGFWPIGYLLAGLVSFFVLERLGWRACFVILGCSGAFIFFLRRILPESPRWLAHKGRMQEADAVVKEIERQVILETGQPLAEVAHDRHSTSLQSAGLLDLVRHQYARRTIMIWLVWFFALLGFYGLTSWLGALLQAAGYSVAKSVSYTLLIALGGIPGFLCTAWLLEKWGRKPVCIAALMGSALMAYLYGRVALLGVPLWQLFSVGFLMQFFLFGMWAVLYAYTPELYPTGLRATGSGFASGIGRIGSLIGPYAVGVILPSVGQTGVFALGAGSFIVAAAAVAVLGVETRGLALEEFNN